MSNYRDNDTFRRLVPEQLVTSTRSRSIASPSGSVLACWLGTDDLARLYDSEVKPMCLLLWLGTVFERAWLNSRRALNLLTGDVGYGNESGEIDPVVLEALRSIALTINHSSPFTHPTDQSKVITALRRLREGGHTYDPDSLCEWALGNGFTFRGMIVLHEYARKVCDDHHFRGIRPEVYRPDILEVWRAGAYGD